ncbi:fluoride efflux transporter FluC [Geodermatophilus sabuli]|uniref:Fluoride-specific ion channel FluC n=1 Tax=Geodermatophilus sabuli TaxID=1564158 RepID=A0A285EES1_9ACTN|nr:CrcB family protein [Geodermatophilus sabuli]MBB3086174.1 CrcB protein [Geodermatophilus sabuli]SNX97609.1 CrcB protein [Geodermatophilus sabuli]
MTPLLVAAGALVGAPLRLLTIRLAVRAGWDPAVGTLAVNVAGSAVLGVLLGLTAVPAAVLALVGTGFCGALTTFSTFGADVLRLVEARALRRALAHAAATVVLGIGAAALGYVLAAW